MPTMSPERERRRCIWEVGPPSDYIYPVSSDRFFQVPALPPSVAGEVAQGSVSIGVSPDSGRVVVELATWLRKLEEDFFVPREKLLSFFDEDDDYADLDVDVPSCARVVGTRRMRLGLRVARSPHLGPLDVDVDVYDEIDSE